MKNEKIVNQAADNIRILSFAMVEKAKSGHPGGPMGGADFINILYSEFLNFDPDDPTWFNRDRFFLDPGHMSPMLYSMLFFCGWLTMDDLKSFRQWGSNTPGHPELNPQVGIENTSGPLGLGHAMAVGAAITERFLAHRFGEWMSHKTYTYISDGGIQEEVSQGAGRIAGYLGLSNLIMFYDSNDVQLSTKTDEVSTEDTALKYQSWGWRVITIDGNNAAEIRKALTDANTEKEKPVLIIGKTIMGKGALTELEESFEGQVSTHGQPLSKAGASIEHTIRNLGGEPENPFYIFPEVKTYYEEVLRKKSRIAKECKEKERTWAKSNPDLAKKLSDFINMSLPELEFEKVVHKPDVATRAASGMILEHLADKLDNLIVMSADLSNSDKTGNFLKKKPAFAKKDMSGGFLHAGVSELTMACIANGMALHGGVTPVCGTFFVFSDFMKPAIRLAALMELPVKYIWTHDSFRVGEDGPTHQPIEHEAQIRLLEQLRNHSGNPSMIVLRPADAAETTVSWEIALENTKSPTAFLLSRQAIKDIHSTGISRYQQALQARKGAHIIKAAKGKPDLILLGNGSEVNTLFEGAELLQADLDIEISIVSLISEGLFMLQEESYRKRIIPENTPVFALTAGLPVTLERVAGKQSRIFGMQHFGYSAPSSVLDSKFGFTANNVADQIRSFVKDLGLEK